MKALVVFSVGVLACVGTQGCGDDDEKKKGSGTIEVRGLFDLTGPTSDVGKSYHAGVMDFIKETNEAGGIDGYTIDVKWTDYAYSADDAVAVYDGWKAEADWSDVVTIFGWGTADTLRLGPTVATDEVPFISASYAGAVASPGSVSDGFEIPDTEGVCSAHTTDTDCGDASADGCVWDTLGSDCALQHSVDNAGYPYNFFAGTDYSTAIRLAMDYISSLGGTQKVAFFRCTAGYCTEPIPAGKTRAMENGLEIASDLTVELGDDSTTIAAAVDTYFQNNPDVTWVWSGNTIGTTASMVDAIIAHAPAGVKLIANVWGFDETMPDRVADAASAAGRVFGVTPFAAYGDTRFTGMDEVVSLHDKGRTREGEEASAFSDMHYVKGHLSFLIWRIAIQRMLNDGTALTGPNIKAELESFNGVQTGGLTSPIGYSATDHRPNASANIYSTTASGTLQWEADVDVTLEDDWLGW